MTPTTPPILGLIGAIGAGKSTVAKLLAERGAGVVDCDRLGHLALEVASVRMELVRRWGTGILYEDGRVNRSAIGRIVFQDASEREFLESVVFPVIGRMTQDHIAELRARPQVRIIVLDAAVLLEAGWRAMCDRILYIDAEENLRQERLKSRSGWTAHDLSARESAQWSAERKRQAADAVIVNDGNLEALNLQLNHVLASWNW